MLFLRALKLAPSSKTAIVGLGNYAFMRALACKAGQRGCAVHPSVGAAADQYYQMAGTALHSSASLASLGHSAPSLRTLGTTQLPSATSLHSGLSIDIASLPTSEQSVDATMAAASHLAAQRPFEDTVGFRVLQQGLQSVTLPHAGLSPIASTASMRGQAQVDSPLPPNVMFAGAPVVQHASPLPLLFLRAHVIV